MSDYRCPYCGSEIDDPDYWESRPEEEYEVECGDCERVFMVSYYLDHVFSVEMPEELESCSECGCWNGFEDYCMFGTKRLADRNAQNKRFGIAIAEPLGNCPLGHTAERGA